MVVAVTLVLGGACNKEEPAMPGEDFRPIALSFAKALCSRDYAGAYALTSSQYRAHVTEDEMSDAFERIVPLDWGETEPVQVGETMTDWPDKREGDVGWAYVNISGDAYSEAVVVVVARDESGLAIRDVQWGRP